MMKFNFLIIFIILISCKEKNTIDSIVIKSDQSNVINLFEGKYKVFHREGQIFSYSFNIEEYEIERIIGAYYKNDLDKMKDSLNVNSYKILMMPYNTTLYTITFSDGRKQEIIIQEDSRTNPLNLKKYRKVKNFLDVINVIIDSKEEITKAPESNILYM